MDAVQLPPKLKHWEINTMTQKGLLEWANYMRHSMVSDPGRKLFQEQVQTHGFSFLDDYLDNILSEVKQEWVRC